MTVRNTPFLRKTLLADAAVGSVASVATIFGAGLLAPLLGLPPSLLTWAGVALIPYVVFLLLLARREDIPVSWLREIVFLNWAWVAASAGILLFAPIQPNMFGVAFIVAQAAAVALFAWLEALPLRGRHRAV